MSNDSWEVSNDPWLSGSTPITYEFEQSVCTALARQGIIHDVLRGKRYERHGYVTIQIAHPGPPSGVDNWFLMTTMEEVHAFLKGWRLCKMAYQSGNRPVEG